MSIKKIKKDTSLRKSILQAAITGQLISDVEGVTETGKQLLDRIIEERNAKLLAEWEETLKKNPKAKKPAPIVASEIDEEEIPFEIPENWCWCRFGEIMINRDSERIPLSVSQRELLEKNYDYYGASGVIDKVDKYLFDKDLLLIGEDGANLLTRSTPIAFIASGKYWVNNHAHVLDCCYKSILTYVAYLINSISLEPFVTGTAQPKMNQEKMNSIPVALPPLSVQNAIVAKLEQVLPLVDVYENAVLEKEELKTALPDKVKKAILQEAITGKLTEDWRKTANITEGGKQLLDRIITERNAKALAEWEEKLKTNPKAKKPTPVVASEIKEDEIPFEVPDSWCLCRLGEVFQITMGQSPEGTNVGETKKGMEFHQGKIFFTDKYIAESNQQTSEITKIAEPGSILLCMRAPVGKVNLTNRKICIGRGLSSVVPLGKISLEWAFHLFETLENEFINKSTGSTFKAITGDVVKDQIIPLPPLEEQKEIVKLVEQMLPLCEKLGDIEHCNTEKL